MTAQDIIEHLEEMQHDAYDDMIIEEVSQSELDQIAGAGWSLEAGWSRANSVRSAVS